MGFRSGAYAKIWEVTPKTANVTSVRLSISKKNRETGDYEQEFSGFVSFVGSSAATMAAKLQPNDRVRLGDVDVTTKYVKEKNQTYTNYSCYSFEMANGDGTSSTFSTRTDSPVESSDPEETDDLPF